MTGEPTSTGRTGAAAGGEAGRKGGGGKVVRTWVRGALLDNLGIKFVAFILALTVFILVHSQESASVGVAIKVSYVMPEEKVLVTSRVAQVEVVVKGSWRRVKRFAEQDHDPIRVDLRNFTSGVFSFKPELIPLPPGLEVETITPANMPLRFEPRAEATVPVRAMSTGEPVRGYGVGVIAVRPRQVRIEGAEEDVRLTSAVYTEDILLTGRSESFTQQVSLRPPRGSVRIIAETPVEVSVTMVEELTARTLDRVPVEIRPGRGLDDGAADRFDIQPSTVRIVLRGARLTTEKVQQKDLSVYVEVYPNDLGVGRKRTAPVQVTGIPAGVAIELKPRDVSVSLRASGGQAGEAR